MDFIELEFWVNPLSEKSYEFLNGFKKNLDYFGKKVKFLPFYKFKDLRDKFVKEVFLEKHCYVKGNFCDLNIFDFHHFSVLEEGLRQICIFENDENYWWEYINFYQSCLTEKFKKNSKIKLLDCHETILKPKNNDFREEIQDCINNSFSNNQNRYLSSNLLLKKNENPNEYKNIYLVPAVFIDNRLVKEELMDTIVISALCEKLTDSPSICENLHNLDNIYNRKIDENEKTNIFWYIFLPSLSLGLIFIFLIIFFVRKRFKKNVNDEVNVEIKDYVSNYMRLS